MISRAYQKLINATVTLNVQKPRLLESAVTQKHQTSFPPFLVPFRNVYVVLTDCIHSSGLEDEEVILLFTQFVAQAECNVTARQRRAPWASGHQEDQTSTENGGRGWKTNKQTVKG